MKDYSDTEFRYSEIFYSIQGEGKGTGTPCAWYRVWGCNFTCLGFGQAHLPRDEWENPTENLDVSQYNSFEELPVLRVGCDSAYSFRKKFEHLSRKGKPPQLAQKIRDQLKSEYNPKGLFKHPHSGEEINMVFTGGEPMISQRAVMEVLRQLIKEGDFPKYITIESNGTQKPKEEFVEFINEVFYENGGQEVFWSTSPKLSASGEKWSDAIKPEVIKQYSELSNNGQLKFVVDGRSETWNEVEQAVKEYRDHGIDWSVWIMPVNSTQEDLSKVQEEIANEAMRRGYHVAARVQAFLFENNVGT